MYNPNKVRVIEDRPSYINGEWRPRSRMIERKVANQDFVEDEDPNYSHNRGTIQYRGREVEVVRYLFDTNWTARVSKV